MGELEGFRVVLKVIYVATIAVMVVFGGVFGFYVGAIGFRDPTPGTFVGALVGGVLGWLFASLVVGIGSTLLSINDHLAAIRKTAGVQDLKVDPYAAPAAAAPAPPPPSAQTPSEWRTALETLPVGKSVLIDGLVVWKMRRRDGQIVFSGEKDFASVDEVMRHYGLDEGARAAR